MTLAANQPYFLPYLGYWQLLSCCDHFLLGDDYAFMRKGWVNRNRILVGGKVQLFRLEIKDQSSFKLISDTEISPRCDIGDKLRTVEMAYHKAPHFNEGYPLIERILLYPDKSLSRALEFSIREIASYLGITTPISRTSEIEGNNLLHREERIYHFCRAMGADTYVNAVGGQVLYSFSEFKERGLRLRFISPRLSPYPQTGTGEFVPGLSILDAVMNCSSEFIHERLLPDFSFIDSPTLR